MAGARGRPKTNKLAKKGKNVATPPPKTKPKPVQVKDKKGKDAPPPGKPTLKAYSKKKGIELLESTDDNVSVVSNVSSAESQSLICGTPPQHVTSIKRKNPPVFSTPKSIQSKRAYNSRSPTTQPVRHRRTPTRFSPPSPAKKSWRTPSRRPPKSDTPPPGKKSQRTPVRSATPSRAKNSQRIPTRSPTPPRVKKSRRTPPRSPTPPRAKKSWRTPPRSPTPPRAKKSRRTPPRSATPSPNRHSRNSPRSPTPPPARHSRDSPRSPTPPPTRHNRDSARSPSPPPTRHSKNYSRSATTTPTRHSRDYRRSPTQQPGRNQQNVGDYEDDLISLNGDFIDAPSDSQVTPNRRYWLIPGKELEMCRLWEEEVNLYDLQDPDHRNPMVRQTSMERISSLLKIPVHVITKRMNTLRTAYQKMMNSAGASGSSPTGKTARMREILRLCSFLYPHVKVCSSFTTYSGPKITGRTTNRPLFIQTKGAARELQKQNLEESTRHTNLEINLTEDQFIDISFSDDEEVTESVACRTRLASTPKDKDKTNQPTYKKGPGGKSSSKKTDKIIEHSKNADNRPESKKKKPGGKDVSVSDQAGTSKTLFKHDSFLDIDKDNDEWYSSQTTMKRKQPPKQNPMMEVMTERSEIMKKMCENIEEMSKNARDNINKEDSADTLWAKSLVLQMARMSQETKDKFMVVVFKLAMDAIAGKLPE